MNRLERIIQVLYYLLVLIFFLGLVSGDQGPLIPKLVTGILLISIVAGMVFFLAKYYFFSKKLK